MKLDPNRVVQKLSMQIAAQSQQIAMLQVQVEQLQEENEKLKKPINTELAAESIPVKEKKAE